MSPVCHHGGSGCCLDTGSRHIFFRLPGSGMVPLQVVQPTQSRLTTFISVIRMYVTEVEYLTFVLIISITHTHISFITYRVLS